mmetsp:Transcript_11395/g.20129  ORF Transcript_11395/g.20129 Transcript_11395/m.20129 type:complete len:187 (-) Transcript_11395:138-698(-)
MVQSSQFPDNEYSMDDRPPDHFTVVGNVVGKRFQLEEQEEDQYRCITELCLLPDHTLQVGNSDGPRFASASGTWKYVEDGSALSITLHRTFRTGHSGTDMGEFSFIVSRELVGELTHVGSALAIVAGDIYSSVSYNDNDEIQLLASSAIRLGFFSMIDTTPQQEPEDDHCGSFFSSQPLPYATLSY